MDENRKAKPIIQGTLQDWVNAHGDMLYRYAVARVGNRPDAEDLVQETFLAAIKAQSFEGRSSPSTWLVGILRHKILDHYRKVYRNRTEEPHSEPSFEAESPDGTLFNSMFRDDGHWKEPIADWGRTPEHTVLDAEFNKILDKCLGKLPDQQRAAFVLRTMEDRSTKEICNDCAVSSTHLGVLLFRARTQLRRCIESVWNSIPGVAP